LLFVPFLYSIIWYNYAKGRRFLQKNIDSDKKEVYNVCILNGEN